MKTHELLPCPFCGSDEVSLLLPTCTKDSKYNPANRAFPSVFCIGCFISVPGRDWDHSGDSAIAAWNRRTEPDEERLAMEAVMESVDPATWPGLTTAQRCALGRFAKPQPAEQQENDHD